MDFYGDMKIGDLPTRGPAIDGPLLEALKNKNDLSVRFMSPQERLAYLTKLPLKPHPSVLDPTPDPSPSPSPSPAPAPAPAPTPSSPSPPSPTKSREGPLNPTDRTGLSSEAARLQEALEAASSNAASPLQAEEVAALKARVAKVSAQLADERRLAEKLKAGDPAAEKEAAENEKLEGKLGALRQDKETLSKRLAELEAAEAVRTTASVDLIHTHSIKTKAPITSIVVLQDQSFAVGCEDGRVRVYSVSGKPRYVLNHGPAVHALVVLPSGRLASGGGRPFFIKVWDEKACVETLSGHTLTVLCLAVLPDGTLASGSKDGTVRLWKDGACEAVLEGHTDHVLCLAVMPENRLASGSADNTIIVWKDGTKLYSLTGHSDHVRALTVLTGSSTGVRLVSGSRDNEIRFWKKTRCVYTMPGHEGTVYALVVSPYNILASGSGDKTVKLWRNGKCVQTLAKHSGWVQAVAFLSGGTMLSGGNDKTLYMWSVRDEVTAADGSAGAGAGSGSGSA